MSDERQSGQYRRVMWQRIDTPGTEICYLAISAIGAQGYNWLIPKVQVALGGMPLEYHCMIGSDVAWRTVNASVISLGQGRRLFLRAEEGRWTIEEGVLGARSSREVHELPDLAGCVDVDLGISPSTNTLPIRRLNLEVGESRELTAAWVRFPELTVEPLAQRYTRLAERRYRYESLVSGFTAELEVDDLGLVISYEGIWRRVAESGPAEHQAQGIQGAD
jgi:hypothetical protein